MHHGLWMNAPPLECGLPYGPWLLVSGRNGAQAGLIVNCGGARLTQSSTQDRMNSSMSYIIMVTVGPVGKGFNELDVLASKYRPSGSGASKVMA